uniref:Uncharacterized protein n=1 Tax=uncultured prokaryote TaxID=198431 RepID=A0A0H5Q735_9ZZZZ|nr:hypothetical protein [uncultured prokaryote]
MAEKPNIEMVNFECAGCGLRGEGYSNAAMSLALRLHRATSSECDRGLREVRWTIVPLFYGQSDSEIIEQLESRMRHPSSSSDEGQSYTQDSATL